MKISTKGRYSLRIMADLAQQSSTEYIPLTDISNRQNISKKYLERIIGPLVKNNFLEALRGQYGGYRLAKTPSQISALEIIQCAEGSLHPVSCLEDDLNQCENCESCLTLPVYQGLQDVISNYLGSITLEDIINNGHQFNN